MSLSVIIISVFAVTSVFVPSEMAVSLGQGAQLKQRSLIAPNTLFIALTGILAPVWMKPWLRDLALPTNTCVWVGDGACSSAKL